jgi:hypothetical protein
MPDELLFRIADLSIIYAGEGCKEQMEVEGKSREE